MKTQNIPDKPGQGSSKKYISEPLIRVLVATITEAYSVLGGSC